MSKITAQILEDNAGGLHVVTDDLRSVFILGCHEDHSQAGCLLADLVSVTEWIDDARNDRPEECDQVTMDEDGMTVIAELNEDGAVTLNTERMGASGRAYAGI